MELSFKDLPSSKNLLNVAWIAVLLGIGMEIILLIVAAGFKKFPAVNVIVAELIQKTSWSTIVCVGVAAGLSIGKMNPPVAGLAGLVSAPIAFSIAKGLHKAAAHTLSVSLPAGGGALPFLLMAIKALEYGTLGWLLTALDRKLTQNPWFFLLSGLIVGVVFGGGALVLMVTQSAEPIPFPGIVSRGVVRWCCISRSGSMSASSEMQNESGEARNRTAL